MKRLLTTLAAAIGLAATTFAATINLSTVTAGTTIPDGTTVTGTLGSNVKLTIAPGATVTLSGATINGGEVIAYSYHGSAFGGGVKLGDGVFIKVGENSGKVVAERFIQNDGQKNYHQHIGERIDYIDDTHHYKVGFSAHIARYRAVNEAYDEDEERREEANAQRNSRSVDDPYKVVAPETVGAEDMREDELARGDTRLFGLAELEGL